MNKFIGIGRIVKSIELKTSNNGKSYVNNAIAIKNDFKNANGEYDTEFINFQVWGKQAEFLAEYASKGILISLEGRIANRQYETNDGQRGFITSIVCESIGILERRIDDEEVTEENSDFDIVVDDNYLE